MMLRTISALLLIILLMPSFAPAAAKRKITLLIVNAKVFTADANGAIAEAVAIDGERIVDVGRSTQLAAKYQAAKVLDVGGKLVTPGFNDAHVHFVRGALALLNVDLTGAPSLAAAKDKVAAKAKETKPGEWIIGRGWDHTLWDGKFPNRKDLDSVAPNNPVFLVRVDGHVAWVNSKAIELAGISTGMKSPDGGEIERDPNGEATGILKETAQGLVNRLIPQPTIEQQRRGLELALKIAREFGITSVQDNSGYETTKLYREFIKQGKLTVRVSEWQSFEDSVAELKRQREEFASFKDDPNRLHLGALKGYVDGTLGSKTASMLAPFTDDAMNSGIPRKSPEDLTRMIVERDKEGWQIALHAIGDRANRMALDGFSEARNENTRPDSRRHRIEHAQVVTPSDFKRFAELGIIASMQPSHAITDQRWADS
ncbi:MAG TPA: amidohydrolase, partial [Pyrinomonadaceae bacterium]|nr:amidohydrolase [Pyrinomonadaceae bacterium]